MLKNIQKSPFLLLVHIRAELLWCIEMECVIVCYTQHTVYFSGTTEELALQIRGLGTLQLGAGEKTYKSLSRVRALLTLHKAAQTVHVCARQ